MRKDDVYTPTSASLWTAPIDPAPLVPGALSGPTVVLFWSDVFDLQPLGQASCCEEAAGSISYNRIWSGYCELGIPQFPGRTADTDGIDLSHSFQQVKRHGT